MELKKFPKAMAVTAAVTFGVGLSFAQTVEIGTWAGFRKGAASFTFDDGYASQASKAAPKFDEYGFKATFNLVTSWGPDYNAFQKTADNGHEIASHSDKHGDPMPASEIASSKSTINQKIKQKYGVITLAYPNCKTPGDQQVTQSYIVGRICNGSWQQVSDVMGKDGPDGGNWAKVPALMTGSTGINDKNGYTGKMQEAMQKGGWVAFLTHGFSGTDNTSYSPTSLDAMVESLKWASDNKEIWVAPMGFVAMYIKERKASQATASTSGDAITIKLTHSIKDNISNYDYPLSLRVKSDWTKVSATQAGASIEAKVDGGYIYVDGVPNAGDIVIKNGNGGSNPTSSSTVTESSSSVAGPASSSSGFNPWNKLSSSEAITAIEMESIDNAHIAAYRSSDNYIVVGGAQGMPITVYNHMGQVVRITRGLGFEQKVYTGAKGAYIVKVGNKIFKVSL